MRALEQHQTGTGGRLKGSRVIVALDYGAAAEALTFAASVAPDQCRLKVGLELYTVAGPALVRELIARGFEVFLDLKYHDIPTTVARATEAAAKLGAWMLTVHTFGGSDMLRAARSAAITATRQLQVVGVTVLTSAGANVLSEIGCPADVGAQVDRLAGLAHAAGLDGVVCSAAEAQGLRQRFGRELRLVVPGIRPAGAAPDDQPRSCTPAEAVARGADYLVIGRPITRAVNPAAALAAINQEIGAHPSIGPI